MPPPATKKAERVADAALDIRERPPLHQDQAFLTRFLVQATLPHRQPRGAPPVWSRRNGAYTLTLRPGIRRDPLTGEHRQLEYPSGVIPRLLMFWVTTQALRTRSRRLELGNNLSAFMRDLGLNPRSGRGPRSDATRLREQMNRLFRSTISFEYEDPGCTRWQDMPVAPAGELWWDSKKPGDSVLWGSWIELGEKFYQAIVEAPVPLDVRALRVISNSPMALDMYAWATYKTYQVNRSGRSQVVSWSQLERQFGAEFSSPKDFRKRAKRALRRVRLVYPGLNIRELRGRLRVLPGQTAVPPKSTSLVAH